MWRHGAALAGFVASLVAVSGRAEGPPTVDVEAGRAHYMMICRNCHGDAGQGDPAQHAPPLAGQAPWYLERQLLGFKRGFRGTHPRDDFGSQMRAMSTTLADDQAVREVVAYIGRFPAGSARRTLAGDRERGAQLYRSCEPCHGSRGQGNILFGAPRLAGGADWYLLTQLENFKEGARGHHEEDLYGRQMASVVTLLPDAEAMRDVLAYVLDLELQP